MSTYLNSASDALAKFSEDRGYVTELFPNNLASTPAIAGMERRAVEFFICVLIWVHVLHCSLSQSLPAAASLYRRILSSATLCQTFLQVVGFESWALIALMDAVGAAIWKREQHVKNRLSMRELVSKSEVILSTIEHHIQYVSFSTLKHSARILTRSQGGRRMHRRSFTLMVSPFTSTPSHRDTVRLCQRFRPPLKSLCRYGRRPHCAMES